MILKDLDRIGLGMIDKRIAVIKPYDNIEAFDLDKANFISEIEGYLKSGATAIAIVADTVFFYNETESEFFQIGSTFEVYIETTHAEAKSIKDASELVKGVRYLITDYQTIHVIPNSGGVINTSPTIEPILVTAISDNEFSHDAKSLLYPSHEIKYDFDLNLAEDGVTQRPGLIYKRFDPELNVSVMADYLGIVSRRCLIESKNYNPGVKVDDSNVTVTINSNTPSLGNRSRYEVSFETMIHPSGQMTLTLQYNNGTIVKPLKYHLGQTPTGTLPANYLSEKKGTIIFNPILDAFVSMFYVDIGANLVGQYLAISSTGYSVNGISFEVNANDFQDSPIFDFNEDIRDIEINGNIDNSANSRYYHPNTIFKSTARNVKIKDFIVGATFTKPVIKLNCGGNIVNALFDARMDDAQIDVLFQSSYLMPEVGSFASLRYRFNIVTNSIIRPTYSVRMNERFEDSIILPASGASNTVINGIIGQTNIFYAGIPISIGSNFYINQGLFRCQIGYFDARGFTINKSLNDITIYEREKLEPTNILGYTEVDGLKIIEVEDTPTGEVKVLGRDENGFVVEADFDGYVTLDGPAQDIDGVKNFGFDRFRVQPQDMFVNTVRFVNANIVDQYTVIPNETVFGFNLNRDFFVCKNEDDGYKIIADLTAFRSITIPDKSGTLAFLDDITAAEIILKISGIINITDIEDGPVIVDPSVFQIDPETGELQIKTHFPFRSGSDIDFVRPGSFGQRKKPLYFDNYNFQNVGNTEEDRNTVIVFLTSDTVPDLISSPPSYLTGNITGTFSTDLSEVNELIFTRVDDQFMRLEINNLPNGDDDPQLYSGMYMHLKLEDSIDPLPDYIIDSGTADLEVVYLHEGGGTAVEPGPVGQAIKFGLDANEGGSRLRLDLSNLATAAFMDLLADGFTVMFWVKVPTTSTTTSRYIFDNGTYDAGNPAGFSIKCQSDGRVMLLVTAIDDSDTIYRLLSPSSNAIENDAVWHWWGFRYNRLTDTMDMKQDNVLLISRSDTVVDNINRFVVSPLNATITHGASSGTKYGMVIDDFVLIPGALSDAEMTRHFNRGDLTGL
jgi:hypothetical protein